MSAEQDAQRERDIAALLDLVEERFDIALSPQLRALVARLRGEGKGEEGRDNG